MDISVTATSVVAGANAVTDRGIAGATITAGQPVYQDSSDSNKLKPTDANSSAATAAAVGIALNGGATGQQVVYQKSGLLTIGATVVAGEVYVVSANAGGIAPADDIAQGWYTTTLGIATTTAILDVKIHVGGVVVA